MAGSKAVLGTITTDANGEGTYTVTKDNGNKELTYDKTYTLLQTARDSRYTLADPADVTINDTLSQKKYAFSFVDTNACVLLKYKLDARTGEKTPEKGQYLRSYSFLLIIKMKRPRQQRQRMLQKREQLPVPPVKQREILVRHSLPSL